VRSFAVEVVLAGLCAGAAAAEPLPRLGADASAFTVSGVSSGGYMAVQMHVAHSSRVKGAAALASGPYFCAQGSLWTAWNRCMTGAPQGSRTDADRLAAQGRIDSTANLAAARVWLFSGTQDRTVAPAVVEALEKQYKLFGAKPVFVKNRPAGHGMVTESAGAACGATEPPFINDCDYDAAGELLRHLLGNLAPPAPKSSGRLVAFEQGTDARGISMAEEGYLYVPRACETERCRIHVAFHGCRQGAEAVGERFVRDAGYNRWADTNRVIVLYPQAIARYAWWVWNPRGCWDWWGYTGQEYATRHAAQVRAVMAMVDRIGEPRK